MYYDADGNSTHYWDKPVQNSTLYARWKLSTSKITFDSNGGSGQTTSVTATYWNHMPLIDFIPSLYGHVFKGFYDAQEGGVQYYEESSSSARNWNKYGDATLYAHFEKDRYTIELRDNSGDGGTHNVVASYDSPMPDPEMAVPYREGYNFLGFALQSSTAPYDWILYYNADLTSARSWLITDHGKKTLLAQWEKASYLVTLDPNEGSGGTSSVTATYDEYLPSAEKPSRTGYEFQGYYDAKTGGTQYYDSNMDSVRNWDSINDSTLFARWTAQSTLITFDLNIEGSSSSTKTAIYGFSMPTSGMYRPNKSGYVFDGYWDALVYGTQYYDSSVKSAKNWDKKDANVTLYARWIANSYTVTLLPNGNGGSNSSIIATYGSPMPTLLAIPYFAGHVFEGYFKSVSGNRVFYYNEHLNKLRNWDIAENSFLYTGWLKITTVPLNRNGGGGGSSSFEAIHTRSMPEGLEAPSRTGYAFEGYYDALTGGTQYYNASMKSMITWDNSTAVSTLYARWTVRTTLISFDSNGGTGGPCVDTRVEGTYGEPLFSLANESAPSKTGFTFNGYWDAPNGGTQYYNASRDNVKNWDKEVDTATLFARWV